MKESYTFFFYSEIVMKLNRNKKNLIYFILALHFFSRLIHSDLEVIADISLFHHLR